LSGYQAWATKPLAETPTELILAPGEESQKHAASRSGAHRQCPGTMRLLIVEDNARLAALVVEALGVRGFSCDRAGSLDEADAALRAASYDVLVLDLGLPDGDGVEWLTSRRESAGFPPVLMLTARNALEDRVKGLDAGADDYLVKPFQTDELAARLRALLRRPGQRMQPVIGIGPLRLHLAARSASVGGKPLDLSRREADLLELLIRRAGSVVGRSLIEDTLYAFDASVTPNAVEAIVSRLRRKLDRTGAGGLLHTIRGVGYLLKETEA
jgi:two-component system, OmpR family, response regulator QseB